MVEDRLKRIAGIHRLRTKMGPAAFLAIAGLRKLRRGGRIALILPSALSPAPVSGTEERRGRNGPGRVAGCQEPDAPGLRGHYCDQHLPVPGGAGLLHRRLRSRPGPDHRPETGGGRENQPTGHLRQPGPGTGGRQGGHPGRRRDNEGRAEARETGFAALDAGDNPGYAATAKVEPGQNWSMQRILEIRLLRITEAVVNPERKGDYLGADLPMIRLGDIAEVETSGGKRELPGEKLQTRREARFNCETEPTGMGQEQGQGWSNITMKDSKWSFIPGRDQEARKAMGAWLMTPMGLMGRWCASTRDQNGRGQATNPQLRAMPVLDLTRLAREQVRKLAELHDRTKTDRLMPACDAWMDDRRLELKREVLEALEVSPQTVRRLENLGILWCLEPTVQGHKGGTKPQAEKMERLQGAAARARAELDDMEAGRKPEQETWAPARSRALHRGKYPAGRPSLPGI